METTTTADGRTVAYEVVGDPDGTPVFWQHGTGDSRLCKHPDDSVTAGLGIKLVTADRPGVGGSSPKKPRGILDWVADAEAVADAAGLEQFVVAGHSGGGPHALAIAQQLGDRVTASRAGSSIAPIDGPRPGGRRQGNGQGQGPEADLQARAREVVGQRGRQGRVQALREAPAQLRGALRRRSGRPTRTSSPTPCSSPCSRPSSPPRSSRAAWARSTTCGDSSTGASHPRTSTNTSRCSSATPTTSSIRRCRRASRSGCRTARSHTWPGAGHYGVYGRWQEFLTAIV